MKLTTLRSDLSRRLRKHKPVPKDGIVHLPVDVLECVADFLPLQSLYNLTLTNSGLRNTLFHRLEAAARELPKEELYEFLTSIVKHCPDSYLCHVCVTIHKAHDLDTPHRRGFGCPRLRYMPLYSGPHNDYYELHHRHVQMTIKLSELKNPTDAETDYLKQLLLPHTRAAYRTNPYDAFGNTMAASYTMAPKVVDGRYLRKGTWKFESFEDAFSIDDIGKVTLCCHLVTAPIVRRANGQLRRWNHTSALHVALVWAFHKGAVIHGKCAFCAVDFTITPQPMGVMIEAWQDLGPQGPVDSPHWRAVVWDRTIQTLPEQMQQNRIKYPARKARSRYGDSQIFPRGKKIRSDKEAIQGYIEDSRIWHPLR